MIPWAGMTGMWHTMMWLKHSHNCVYTCVVCEITASIGSHIAWTRCCFTVPTRHLWYFVSKSLFIFHQPNSNASGKSCKHTHGLVKCPFNCYLLWLLWVLFLCASGDTDLGVNQREITKGTVASATIWTGFAVCTAGKRWRQVGILSCLLRREQKTNPTWGLILTQDMRWHISFSSPHHRFSGVVLLWQQATGANCVGSSLTENLHGPPYVCLFGIAVLFFFVFWGQFHAIWVGSDTAEAVFSLLAPL